MAGPLAFQGIEGRAALILLLVASRYATTGTPSTPIAREAYWPAPPAVEHRDPLVAARAGGVVAAGGPEILGRGRRVVLSEAAAAAVRRFSGRDRGLIRAPLMNVAATAVPPRAMTSARRATWCRPR